MKITDVNEKLNSQSELLVRLLSLTVILSGSTHAANQIQPCEKHLHPSKSKKLKKKVLFGANETQSRFHKRTKSCLEVFRTFHRRLTSDEIGQEAPHVYIVSAPLLWKMVGGTFSRWL